MAGVVSEEDFAELSAGDWLEMAWVHVHAGVREVITEAYWEKVGPMGGDPHKNPVETHTKTQWRPTQKPSGDPHKNPVETHTKTQWRPTQKPSGDPHKNYV